MPVRYTINIPAVFVSHTVSHTIPAWNVGEHLFKHCGCNARLLFKHFGCKERLMYKHFGCKTRLLFTHFWYKPRLLFKHFGYKPRILLKVFGCKARLLFKHLNFGYKAKPLFYHYGCKARLFVNIYGAKQDFSSKLGHGVQSKNFVHTFCNTAQTFLLQSKTFVWHFGCKARH